MSALPALAASSSLDSLAATELVGPSPVMRGEDERGFEELLRRVSAALQPADVVEEMYIYDIVVLIWDVCRLRRIKAHELNHIAARQIRELIKPFVVGNVGEVCRQWELGYEAGAERVNAALTAAGLSTRSLVTSTLELSAFDLEKIGQIERMVANAEARRSAALKDLDRYHENFGARLRRALEAEEEGNLKVLAPPIGQDGASG